MAVEGGDVGGGDAGDHAGQALLQGGQEGGGVPTQRQSVGADGRGPQAPQPAHHAAHVPHGLSQAVDAVDEVEGHEAVAAAPARGPGSVEGQHRQQHVDPVGAVELGGPEGAQVDGRGSRAEPVQAHQPGPGQVPGAQHPGVGRPVGAMGHPPLAAGLVGVGLVAAGEGKVLEGDARGPLGDQVPRADGVGRKVVGGGVVGPAPGLEEGVGRQRLLLGPGVVVPAGVEARVPQDRQHQLVHGDLQPQGGRERGEHGRGGQARVGQRARPRAGEEPDGVGRDLEQADQARVDDP